MMLPSFAAERQHASSATPTVRPQLLINISFVQGAQQQTRQPLLLSINGTDRQMDGHPTVTETLPCSAYCVCSDNKMKLSS